VGRVVVNDIRMPPRPAPTPDSGLRLPGAGERLVRFGIGVLAVEPIVDRLDRRIPRRSVKDSSPAQGWGVIETGRLEVAMAAYVLGYFLVDTVQVSDGRDLTGPGWARVRRLAVATEADALLLHGPVDPAAVEPFAAELRLVARVVRDVIAHPSFGPSQNSLPGSSSWPGWSAWWGWLGAWGAAPQPPKGGNDR
jgi:hypothetical protein